MQVPKPKHKKVSRSRKGAVQKRMKEYLEAHPICEKCKTAKAVEAHHIVNVGMGGVSKESWKHTEINFMALCRDCHIAAHLKSWQFDKFIINL